MGSIAGRNAILAIARKSIDVDVAGVGTFRLREMSGAERDRFEAAAFQEKVDIVNGKPEVRRTVNPIDLRARLVGSCLVDDAGARLFADDEVEQLSAGVPASTLQTLFVAAQKLNGLDGEAVEAAKENFPAAPTDGSSSASH